MAENYKEFDKSPIIDTSDVVIKGFRFRVREAALAIAVVVCILVIIILAALLGSANSGSDSSDCDNQCFTPDCLKSAAHTAELLNSSIDPCQDFHSFACGHFSDLHPLLPYEDGMSTFQLVHDRNWDRLRTLLEQNLHPSKATPQHWERKMRDFFYSCQDHYSKMQLQGKPFLDQIVSKSGGWWALMGDSAWQGKSYDFQDQMEKVHVDFWTNAFFTFRLGVDRLDWTQNVLQIDLSGMGLHYGYYYDTTIPNQADILSDYMKYIRNIGGLLLRDADLTLDDDEKKVRLDTFVNDAFFVESELAMLKKDSPRDYNAHDHENRMKLSDLNSAAGPDLDWVAFFSYMFDGHVDANTEVVVHEKVYIAKFAQWIANLPSSNKTRILNNYMVWRLADRYDQDLSWDYIHANRKIYVDVNGQQNFLGTYRYCLYKIDRDMKEALGALFISNHFSDQNKRKVHLITDYIKQSMVSYLDESTWMSDPSKKDALQKLKKSIIELGYPEYLSDTDQLNAMYSKLEISHDEYMANVLSFNKFYKARWIQYLTQPSDHTIWPYAAYDFVAHYYSPWKQLFVPAGLLQFPIFDHSSPEYANFGSMGTIVGRQLTHAVDEYGNSYSLSGTGPGKWWSNATTNQYKDIKDCMIDALTNQTVGPYHIGDDPKKMIPLGESRADHYSPLALSESSSLKLAFRAYHSWMDVTQDKSKMPGAKYTNDQMFFISYAQSHCITRDPDRELTKLLDADRIPEKITVNSAVSHVPEFKKAFSCSNKSPMVAPKVCSFF